MSIIKIQTILDAHGVPFYIRGDRVFADSMAASTAIFEEVVDITDYTPGQLRTWLGY